MKPCNIGIQGTCCKNCAMGPCRLPLPKAGIEGEDERKGLCGATANTIAARNFVRMIAAGASAAKRSQFRTSREQLALLRERVMVGTREGALWGGAHYYNSLDDAERLLLGIGAEIGVFSMSDEEQETEAEDA